MGRRVRRLDRRRQDADEELVERDRDTTAREPVEDDDAVDDSELEVHRAASLGADEVAHREIFAWELRATCFRQAREL